jgi:hypothetical protein
MSVFDDRCYLCGEPKFDSRFGLICERCAKLLSETKPNEKTYSGLLEENHG